MPVPIYRVMTKDEQRDAVRRRITPDFCRALLNHLSDSPRDALRIAGIDVSWHRVWSDELAENSVGVKTYFDRYITDVDNALNRSHASVSEKDIGGTVRFANTQIRRVALRLNKCLSEAASITDDEAQPVAFLLLISGVDKDLVAQTYGSAARVIELIMRGEKPDTAALRLIHDIDDGIIGGLREGKVGK